MVTDFHKRPLQYTPVSIQGSDIEVEDSFKYLCVHLNKKLDWTHNTDALYKKGQSSLHLLRRLRSFGVCRPLLRTFQYSVVASVIHYAVACWGADSTDRDRKTLNKLKWIRFGSSCYFFSEERKSWDKARESCRAREADLVVINTKEENAFISALKNQSVWLGLSDRDLEGTWKWVDGSSLTLFWGSDQPDNSGEEDCGHIRNGFPGVWNDISCLSSMQWICEKEQMLFV
uniref:C-type lectin domain-containing protein n=1 Tax=Oryzias latipes TaxID=8090 RepID=A0A3P9MCZ6_ORYLA